MLQSTTRLVKKNKTPMKFRIRKIREILKDGAEVEGANFTCFINGLQYTFEVKDL